MQLEKMKEQNQKFSQPAEAKAYTVEGPRLTQWRGQSLHSGGAKAYTVEGPRLTQWRSQGLHSGEAKAYTVEGPRLTQWRARHLFPCHWNIQDALMEAKSNYKPQQACQPWHEPASDWGGHLDALTVP
jgi:hypothetical protein